MNDFRRFDVTSGNNMTARIYRPAKSATQSGAARTKAWLLEYMPHEPRQIEPLMGWTSSGDMNSQLKLWFATCDEAVAYAQREGITYRVEQPKPATRRVMSYSDNFKTNRIGQWTH
ncbi:MAG: complex subunit [Hyphomicrobiales bacterium]|nr:complex subunit [Hyphomicrobiales bacterium]